MTTAWWKDSIAYHIYPRSFQDSNGDGFGDIPGIISRLDYLKRLGVDLVMLGPVYPTPDDDNGYDISDYFDIDPRCGTMQDWRRLRDGLHERGMKIVMDVVINHTSDEHRWFLRSRSSRTSPYRDFYHWQPGTAGGPPNNWASVFGGSAWERDEATDEYYLHLYSRKQPDLNWRNPEVRKRLHEVVRFWIDEGVDGFRLDTITTISKVPGYPDAPISTPGPLQPAHELIFNGPEILDFLGELRSDVLNDSDVVTIGEGPGVGATQAQRYLDPIAGVMDMLFQWEHIDADPGSGGKWAPEWWTVDHFITTMSNWQHAIAAVGGWNTLYLSNHDQPRQVSRFGDDGRFRVQSAKMLAAALYLLQGTPFIYQGEELGMTNANYPSITDYRDLESLNYYRQAVDRGEDPADVLELVRRKSRDNGRTPMQWDSTANAGFTTDVPWIAVNPNASWLNVAAQEADPDSVFNFYRKLIQLRREHRVIRDGVYSRIPTDSPIFAYSRSTPETAVHVITNFADTDSPFDWTRLPWSADMRVVLANYPDAGVLNGRALRPFECLVFISARPHGTERP